jgi:drug/metabolite transporter (DMT)-like permease
MPTVFGIGMVLIAITTWATSSIAYKAALGNQGSVERDPISSVGVRVLIITCGMVFLTLIFGDITAIFTLDKEIRTEYWIYTLLGAFFSVCGDFCYFHAARCIDISRIYPLINCQMLFTYPISYYVFHEVIPPMIFLSATLIILGVMFVGNPDSDDKGMDMHSPEDKKKYHRRGVILGILTGFFFAMIYISMALQNRVWYGTVESNFGRMLLYSVLTWTYILLTRKHIPWRNTPEKKEAFRAYCMMGFFGIFSAGIGDWIYQIGVKENGTAVSITIASAAPLINQFLAIIFLKEKFRYKFLIGALLIIIGNILIIF